MTLPTGQLAISDINAELGLPASYSSSLSFLTGYMKSPPASPSLGAFQGLAYYRRNADGNCNNGNCTASGGPNGNCTNPNSPNGNCSNAGGPNGNCTSNCNCGNIQCTNCYIAGASDCANCQVCTAINCSNCEVCTPSNCSNCANCGAINCSNCDGQNYLQANCNCACTYNCTQSAVSYNCNTSAVSYNCSTSAVSYNCTVGPVSYNCNCACNCSKIVCAKFYDMGMMSQEIWSADQAYGRVLRKKDKTIYRGYIKWAKICTEWMDGRGPDFMPWIANEQERKLRQKEFATDILYRVGQPWSEHMAYIMGTLNRDNDYGRVLMSIGRPLCKFFGSIPRAPRAYRNHGFFTAWTILSLLYFSYYAGKGILKLKNLISVAKAKLFQDA